MTSGGLRYIDRGDHVPEPEAPKPKRAAKPRAKNDPKHVAAARELRDRYLEQINTQPLLENGKYDVSRALEGAGAPDQKTSAQSATPRVLPSPIAA